MRRRGGVIRDLRRRILSRGAGHVGGECLANDICSLLIQRRCSHGREQSLLDGRAPTDRNFFQ